jgi:hypothetical protein
VAWDQSIGTAGGTADLAAPGFSGPAGTFSTERDLAFALIGAVNDRPVLDPGGVTRLPPVAPGETEPSGTAVSALLGLAATDADPGSALGVALTAAASSKRGGGAWQYRLGSVPWQPVGAVSARAALLLGPADSVRFVPAAGFAGTASLTYKAWDQSAPPAAAAGTRVPIAPSSTASETATLPVNAVNDRPALDVSGSPVLAWSLPATPPAEVEWHTVASLLGTSVTDPDPGALSGIAITGVTGLGTWEVMIDGGPPVALGAVSPAAARLLRATDQIRFVPAAGFRGAVQLKYRAWDQTGNSPTGPPT